MEQKDYLRVKHAIEKAEDNTKPIATVVDDQVVARGDVNDIEVLSKDYTADFVVPKDLAPEGAEKLKTGFYKFSIEYKDVLPTVKQGVKLTSAGVQLLPFFKSLKDDGTIENMSDAEALQEIYANLADETVDALYWLVVAFLNIDKELEEYLTPGSAIRIGASLVEDFPHVFDQSDLF